MSSSPCCCRKPRSITAPDDESCSGYGADRIRAGNGVVEADVGGPVGLYVAPENEARSPVWQATTAVLEPVGQVDLTWRGFRYDTYLMQKLTNWRPVLSPSPGDPLFKAVPH